MPLAPRTAANRRVRIRHYPYSVWLNGVDGAITAPIDGFLPAINAGSFTIATWFKTDARTQSYLYGVFNTGNTTAFGLLFNHNTSGTTTEGKMGMFVRDNDNEFQNWATTNTFVFSDSKWHHCVLTGTPSTNTWVLYIDSVSQALTTPSPSGVMNAFSNPSTAQGLAFGCRNVVGTFGGFTSVSVAEILMYTSTLSQAQVTELYYDGVIPASPFRHLKCDTGSGTSIVDSSSNAVHATLVVPTTGGWKTDSPMKSRN